MVEPLPATVSFDRCLSVTSDCRFLIAPPGDSRLLLALRTAGASLIPPTAVLSVVLTPVAGVMPPGRVCESNGRNSKSLDSTPPSGATATGPRSTGDESFVILAGDAWTVLPVSDAKGKVAVGGLAATAIKSL